GDPRWRGTSGLVVGLAVLALVLLITSVTRRWTWQRGTRTGALVVWSLVSLALAVKAPGASYLFLWPAFFAGLAAITPRWARAAEWFAAAMTILLLIGFGGIMSVVVLGVSGVGAIALGVIVALVALLLLPQLEIVAADAKWLGAGWVAAAALVVIVIGAFVTR